MIHELTPVRPAVRAVVRWQSRGSGCGLGFQDARAPAKTSGYIGYMVALSRFPPLVAVARHSYPIEKKSTVMEIIPVNIDLTQGILLLTAAVATKQLDFKVGDELNNLRIWHGGGLGARPYEPCAIAARNPAVLGPRANKNKKDSSVCSTLLNLLARTRFKRFKRFKRFIKICVCIHLYASLPLTKLIKCWSCSTSNPHRFAG